MKRAVSYVAQHGVGFSLVSDHGGKADKDETREPHQDHEGARHLDIAQRDSHDPTPSPSLRFPNIDGSRLSHTEPGDSEDKKDETPSQNQRAGHLARRRRLAAIHAEQEAASELDKGDEEGDVRNSLQKHGRAHEVGGNLREGDREGEGRRAAQLKPNLKASPDGVDSACSLDSGSAQK